MEWSIRIIVIVRVVECRVVIARNQTESGLGRVSRRLKGSVQGMCAHSIERLWCRHVIEGGGYIVGHERRIR